ncbi:transglutaminase domain-containing protein [uncultured Bacteroides sp.]|uniref:transglutaminase domain-containing protein n=1 Tax=uncultured Bacteroides sp. TaxID=162156 RepID=UPI002674BEA1|nr:transglutaminase domain-containing protein [uncultured Bacteroides sp.]
MNKNTHIRLLFIPILSVVLLACGESHFLKEETYRNRVIQDFEQKRQALPHGDLFAIFSDATLTVAEREALMFLYAYMPIGDITDYSGEYYLENLRLSGQVRREMPWGKEVTDELFRHFVLPIRVNNENLDDSRSVFYEELRERVKGLSMKDAILEVNHWCHEKVAYRPSDARTSSPLATVKTAYGRCGEESTFTVAALRSVGIPARQVYTPRWAHTDDNHAWVEAWADGKWYFLGACEPEPVLNLGWFNAPASRGMLMHTKVFGRYDGPEEVMLETPNYTEINVTENYAPTAKATVLVTDADGRPVSGAKVDFKVYNYAEFYTVASKYAGTDGRVSLTAGKGDMLVWASDRGMFGFSKLSFGKQTELTLVLDKREGDVFETDIDIVPPVENADLPGVTPEQRAENDCRLAQEDSLRNVYIATFPTAGQIDSVISGLKEKVSPCVRKVLHSFITDSRGNHKVLVRFIQEADRQRKLMKGIALLRMLSEKDRRDVSYEVLEDHFLHTRDVSDDLYDCALSACATCTDVCPAEVKDILNPRIGTEMLTPYRAFFQSKFTEAQADSFRIHPQLLVEWVSNHIAVDEKNNSQRIPVSPEGVWRSRVADSYSRNVFFVALARSMDIPARMRDTDGCVGYVLFSDRKRVPAGEFVKADFDKKESVRAYEGFYRLYDGKEPIACGDDRAKYYNKFTISRIVDGRPELISFDENNPDERVSGILDAGYYLLVTGTRLADGSVLSRISSFVLPACTLPSGKVGFEPTKVPYHLRESGEKVAVIGNFNSESLFTPVKGTGEKTELLSEQSLLQACGRGYFVVGILGPGQEPTNHALRDIAVFKSELEKWGRKLVLLFPDEARYRRFLPSEFPELPSTVIYGIDTGGICKQIIEGMKLKHQDSLPVFVIADTFNRVVFVSQGYTIGLGEQLMKTVRGL